MFSLLSLLQAFHQKQYHCLKTVKLLCPSSVGCLLFVFPLAKNEKWTHHTIGICVTSFRHRETLDNFWSHPWESSNQGHVCCMVVKPRGTKITDLKKEKKVSTFYLLTDKNTVTKKPAFEIYKFLLKIFKVLPSIPHQQL